MKVYIPHHSGAAGFWIYEGYRAAWESLDFDTEYIEHITGNMPTETPEEYDAMLVEGALDYSDPAVLKFLDGARKVYMFVQPTRFPKPWGTHPNFYSSAPDSFISEINDRENVFLWSFVDTEKCDFYDAWKHIEHVPLAFDSINYKGIKDEHFEFDVCYVGGTANNGFNEKRSIMIEYFTAIEDLGIKAGIFINRNITREEEAKVLFNSKIALNIHDKYQQVLGLDTNERTFKALGLAGFVVSDKVDCLNVMFPSMPLSESPEKMAENIKWCLEEDLSTIKDLNRKDIMRGHTYKNRVEKFLNL